MRNILFIMALLLGASICQETAPTVVTTVGSPEENNDLGPYSLGTVKSSRIKRYLDRRTPAQDYIDMTTSAHTVHRTNHSASAMLYSSSLASSAATVAASCKFAHNTSVGGGGYGQNIAAYGSSGNVAALNPTSMLAMAIHNQWYNGEINSFLPSYYGQANPPNFAAWGHFSQIVWKGTTYAGCASQYCPSGTIFSGFQSWFTVCNYSPPGNYGGQYGTQIGRPLGQPTVRV